MSLLEELTLELKRFDKLGYANSVLALARLSVLESDCADKEIYIAELEAQLARPLSMTPRQLAKEIAQGHNYSIGHPPTSAVPEARYPDDGMGDDDAYNAGWNDCREAMRAAAQEKGDG